MALIYLIYFFKNRNKFSEKIDLKRFYSSFLRKLKYLFVFLLFSFSNPEESSNTSETIVFNVSRHNDSIGFVEIKRKKLDNVTNYIIDSEVNVRVIFNFKANGHERSIYKDDVLVYSSMYRKMNDKLKLDQSLTLENGRYIFKNRGKKEKLPLNTIKHNLVTLLYKEPKGIHEVYSDRFKCMVEIVFLGSEKYKISLPNNSTSTYYYKNNECIKVELKGSFYKVDLVRKFQNVKS
ncbi:DUF6134 family protein [Yeosuana sp. MJ-SS3]|uniref:DUF6134 family protein n=1 Tax=Gilvirhabdus luticola TaxID=3079858 RepID=A0ABU3U4E7_9FLAO|nr:DUF6134 family protein [Yeosuana sp. MJ-SS3]MDU8885221.1 DUF6134 family protein [Yeosuana sp. MJ-SS3]